MKRESKGRVCGVAAKTANTEAFFAKRRQKADFKGFDRIMARKGGVAPEGDDVL
jgi:hypothetical protein